MGMLAYTPVELTYLETLANIIIIPAIQNQFIKENILNNAPFRRIATAMNTNSLDRTLKYFSGINNLISDKLKY